MSYLAFQNNFKIVFNLLQASKLCASLCNVYVSLEDFTVNI